MNTNVHRRYNPLLKKWVLISPHRSNRPWQGEQIPGDNSKKSSYDSKCYLCPNNVRANGESNPQYDSTYTFTNDFPALIPTTNHTTTNSDIPFIQSTDVSGLCKVICFSPRHDLTIAEMSAEQIIQIVMTWKSEFESLAKDENIKYVTIFENKGSMMGCSNPHPHGQIWATSYIPTNPNIAYSSQSEYFSKSKSSLIQDYVQFEIVARERIVHENEDWIAVVPYWAEWPFEIMIAPKKTLRNLSCLNNQLASSWAEIISIVTIKYDNLFKTSFPYSMGIYQEPCNDNTWEGASVYQSFLPPLLRSSSIRKYMVGFEMISESQRDITAESAAMLLREQSNKHYNDKSL